MNAFNITPYVRYTVYRECPSSGWRIGTRTIPDHEFVLITGGKGVIKIEEKVFHARQGMLFYFYPCLVHSLKSSLEQPMSFYGLHFSYGHAAYQNNQWHIGNGNTPLPLSSVIEVSAYPKVESLMKHIVRYWITKNTGYELICNGLFLKLFYQLMEDVVLNHVNYGARLKVQEIIQYIQKNSQKKFSIKELSVSVSLSPDYMATIFKSFTGLSPVKYINKCRADAAKDLLIHGGISVKDAAFRVGFKDEFYFSRVFKQLEGISPQEFCQKFSLSGRPAEG